MPKKPSVLPKRPKPTTKAPQMPVEAPSKPQEPSKAVEAPPVTPTFESYWNSLSLEDKHRMRFTAEMRGMTLQNLYRTHTHLCP